MVGINKGAGFTFTTSPACFPTDLSTTSATTPNFSPRTPSIKDTSSTSQDRKLLLFSPTVIDANTGGVFSFAISHSCFLADDFPTAPTIPSNFSSSCFLTEGFPTAATSSLPSIPLKDAPFTSHDRICAPTSQNLKSSPTQPPTSFPPQPLIQPEAPPQTIPGRHQTFETSPETHDTTPRMVLANFHIRSSDPSLRGIFSLTLTCPCPRDASSPNSNSNSNFVSVSFSTAPGAGVAPCCSAGLESSS